MPKSDLNLVPQEVMKERESQRTAGSLSVLSLAFFVLCVLIVSGAFLYETIIIRQVNAIESKEKAMTEELVTLKDVEMKVRSFEFKTKNLSTVFGKRLYFSKLLSKVKELTPDGVAIDELFEVSPTEINLSGTTQGYLSIASFMEALSSDKEFVEKVLGPSASTDRQTGQTKFTITVILKLDALKKI